MNGWVKIYRQLADNPIWLIKPFSQGQAWIDLLLITTFDEGFIKIRNGEIIKLKKGECGYSQLTLSKRWGWSRGKVKRYLNLLESEKMIQQKIIDNYTIINILSFDKFQNGQQTIQQTDNKRTTNDTTNGHYQEGKEGKEGISFSLLNEKNEKTKKIDPYVNPINQFFISEYEKVFNTKPRLLANQCNKLLELASEMKDFRETIPETLKKLKKVKFDLPNFTPNYLWLLKDDNYLKVLEGTYQEKEEEKYDFDKDYNPYN